MVWSAEDLGPIGVVTWLGFVNARTRQWSRVSQGVAGMHASDGSGTHRSCLEPQRGAPVPRAAVASAADGVTNGAVDDRGVERCTCAQMLANRASRGLENSFPVWRTG